MRIKLNNKFYNKKAVDEALNDFKEICNGKILNNNIKWGWVKESIPIISHPRLLRE